MRIVNFVTNRPAVTGGFGPPPSCGPDETLTFGALPVEPSADPARPGLAAGPLALSGAIPCRVPGPDTPLVGFLARVLSDAVRAGRLPLVMVHGYSYGFLDAATRTADVCAWLEAGKAPTALAPILFTWPSICGITADNYQADRARAAASARAMSRFVVAFAAAWRLIGQPRSLFLAHSMGAWTTQNGMRALAAMQGLNLPSNLFEQAFVLAGDADTNAFEPGQGLDQLARLAKWVSVGVNRTDFATGVTAAEILKRPRLGSSGPASVARLPDNVRVVDYTLTVTADSHDLPPGETTWNYKLHQYYRTVPAVRDDLLAAIAGGSPDQVWHRMSSDDMRKAGQVGIKPGRLYVCPPAPPVLADTVAEHRGS